MQKLASCTEKSLLLTDSVQSHTWDGNSNKSANQKAESNCVGENQTKHGKTDDHVCCVPIRVLVYTALGDDPFFTKISNHLRDSCAEDHPKEKSAGKELKRQNNCNHKQQYAQYFFHRVYLLHLVRRFPSEIVYRFLRDMY